MLYMGLLLEPTTSKIVFCIPVNYDLTSKLQVLMGCIERYS